MPTMTHAWQGIAEAGRASATAEGRRTDSARARATRRIWTREALLVGSFSSLAILGLLLTNPGDFSLGTRFLAASVAALGLAPGILWLGRGARLTLPVFEIYMAFHAVTFGFAGFMEQVSTLTIRSALPEDAWRAALWVALLAEASTIVGYAAIATAKTGGMTRVPTKWERQDGVIREWKGVLLLGAVFLGAMGPMVPAALRQVTGNVSVFWCYALIIGALRMELPKEQRYLVYFGLAPFMLLWLSSFRMGAIYGLFSTLIPLAVAFTTVRRRVPLGLGATVVAVFFLLQPVKSEFRELTWGDQSGGGETNPADFVSLGVTRLGDFLKSGGTAAEWMAQGFGRLNHLHVTGAVILETPSRVPFQNGATYVALFTKLVPRALWPDKPLEDLGNRWAHEYGFLHSRDYVTSFNLPFVTEMFMNFGYWGVLGVSALMGAGMRKLTATLWRADASTPILALGLLVALPFFTPESNLSLQVGRALISGVSAWGSLVVLGWLSKRQAPQLKVPHVKGRK